MKVSIFVISFMLLFSLLPSTWIFADGGGHDDNEVEFTGIVESLPSGGFVGDWRIAGRTVHVTSSTEINQEDGHITVGSTVKVEGAARADTSVDAKEIELEEGDQDDDQGGAAQVEFKGTIQSLPPAPFIGDWKVGGKTIHVTASTRIEAEIGPVAVGAFAEIHGTQRADGSIDATKVEVESNVGDDDGRNELTGTVEHLPAGTLIGDWTVSGHTVHVTASTTIDQEHGAVAVGVTVEVQGTLRSDGSLDATRIEVKAAGGHSEGASVNLKGTVESLPSTPDLVGDWIVKGKTVHVTSSTRLSDEPGAFRPGLRVKVKGMQMADGTIVATKIRSKN